MPWKRWLNTLILISFSAMLSQTRPVGLVPAALLREPFQGPNDLHVARPFGPSSVFTSLALDTVDHHILSNPFFTCVYPQVRAPSHLTAYSFLVSFAASYFHPNLLMVEAQVCPWTPSTPLLTSNLMTLNTLHTLWSAQLSLFSRPIPWTPNANIQWSLVISSWLFKSYLRFNLSQTDQSLSTPLKIPTQFSGFIYFSRWQLSPSRWSCQNSWGCAWHSP